MTKMVLKYIAILSIMIVVTPAGSDLSGNVMKVKEIEFRGLVNVTKYEIVRKTDARAGSDGITLNTDTLARVLKEMPIIEQFSISNSGDRMVVRVTEKKPYATLAVKRGNRLIPFEVDDRFRVISRDVIYGTGNPLIIIGPGDMSGGSLKEHVKRLCGLLKEMEKSRGDLISQISEMTLEGPGSLQVALHNRKTRFFITPDRAGFNRLYHMSGYLDWLRYYPGRVYVTGTAAVIKP